MKTSRSTVIGKRCLLLLAMSLWAVATHAAECRHPIPLLGGSTAIYRGQPLDSVAKLQEALKSKKTLKAFQETLAAANLEARSQEVMDLIAHLQDTDKKPYGPKAQFVWMAYRARSDKKVHLLKHSCWGGEDSFEAWPIELKVDGQQRTYIIPTTCLNLALLPPIKGELSCDLKAHIDCSSSPSKVTLTAIPRATGEARIDQVIFTQVEPPGGATQTVTTHPYEATFDLSDSGSYSAMVVDNRDTKGKSIKSTACTTEVAVCERPPVVTPSCETPPSCQLTAAGSWSDGKGDLAIGLAGSTGDHFTVDITGPERHTLEPTNPKDPIQQPVSQPGVYTIQLTAASKDKRCRQAVCTTNVNIPPPTPPCCDSLWLLRTYAAYVEAQGSHQAGQLRTANNEIGAFKFGFNEGLGAGLELEWLFDGRKEAKWGWTLGLSRADLNTIWQLDTPTHWVRDKDRVPMLTLTTGVNYHWGGPRWNFFLGPVIGYSHFDDGTYADTSLKPGIFRANFDDSFIYGGNIGFDGFLGKCWGITGGVEYLKAATKANFLDVDIDPLIIRAGFVYHF